MVTGILLVNLGTPDSPSVSDVRRYLRQFLMDGRVIDIPLMARFLLVNGIIAPFRAPRSAAAYRKVWTPAGSPLKVYSEKLAELVQEQLGPAYAVRLAMRYQNPSIESALENLKNLNPAALLVVPLFPQYASATNGSVVEETGRILKKWQTIPALAFTGPFSEAGFFIEPIVRMIRQAREENNFDHLLFTYHGLPERHIRKGDTTGKCLTSGCCDTLHPGNSLCYRAQCFATTRAIAGRLGLSEKDCTTSFQSRLGRDPWIKPYTDKEIRTFPARGIQSVLALSPSFVADCLETIEEIGDEYREVFEEAGGKNWSLLPCVNTEEDWVKGLAGWIRAFSVLPEQNTMALRPG
jgi:ferrochelatase